MTFAEVWMSLELGLIYGLVALGVYLTFRTIDFPDLTCDGSFVLGAALSTILIQKGFSPWLALGSAFLGGSLAGLSTGLLHTHLNVRDLLSGILVCFILYSVNLRVMQGAPNITLLHTHTLFSQGHALGLLIPLCLILGLVMCYGLYTQLGLGLRAVGYHKRFARHQGMPLSLLMLIGLTLSNGFIALGGSLLSQHQGFADIGSGIGTLTIALAAIMIGECLLPFRSIWIGVLGCFVGSILYRLFISCALHIHILGLQPHDLNLITGVMVLGVILLPRKKHALAGTH